ncbi:uncharacterized protein PGTG_21918 [Puccinia graminis f. sp. tritici CRL 75-36-700-3]|uniref:USP domain-containing protein n=1 Tax=Puccinia graminis f. sp. tritici (strain CRL 75-36-700-3 / race SCCL) TaxID=418459 RepID=H6QT01_PUCGT|nr:uncharacterized protein PGTG_21918 [Puccinia graminis f. sp. tritici CRL 75-36-700-3]EHS63964.1 hypothetical protein PGTG_21918 [Puccinia graminis f. sp. tritici CRL 75-36-700-3]
MDISTVTNERARDGFMDNVSWPFKLTVGGCVYTLISRGYWGGSHYWCKVLQTHGKTTWVWLHNNAQNDGYAHLISAVPGSIAGADKSTSFLMYSRAWDALEEEHVQVAIQKIKHSHPNPPGEMIFKKLKNLLTISADAESDAGGDDEDLQTCKQPDSNQAPSETRQPNDEDEDEYEDEQQFAVFESDFVGLAKEEQLVTQSYRTKGEQTPAPKPEQVTKPEKPSKPAIKRKWKPTKVKVKKDPPTVNKTAVIKSELVPPNTADPAEERPKVDPKKSEIVQPHTAYPAEELPNVVPKLVLRLKVNPPIEQGAKAPSSQPKLTSPKITQTEKKAPSTQPKLTSPEQITQPKRRSQRMKVKM